MNLLTKILRMGEGRKARALQKRVATVTTLEPEVQQLSDEVVAVFTRWGNREIPDDGVHREPVRFTRVHPGETLLRQAAE